jgi:hypothetical protein
MLKFTSAVLAAAAIAGALTFLTAVSDRLDAGPLAVPTQAAVNECNLRPWPYLGCSETPIGYSGIRLITTDRVTL